MSSPEFESRPSPPVDNPFVRFWVDVWRCIRRVVTSNFQTTRVTDREAGKLAFSGTPISEPVGQSYAAWRRSALWIAAIALFIHVIILFSTFQTTETAFREAAIEGTTVQALGNRAKQAVAELEALCDQVESELQ